MPTTFNTASNIWGISRTETGITLGWMIKKQLEVEMFFKKKEHS